MTEKREVVERPLLRLQWCISDLFYLWIERDVLTRDDVRVSSTDVLYIDFFGLEIDLDEMPSDPYSGIMHSDST